MKKEIKRNKYFTKMKKVILGVTIFAALASCKKEVEKPVVVGTNEQGEELVVNKTGDTVVYVAPAVEEKKEEVKETKVEEKTAFKAQADGTYTFKFNLEKGKTYPFTIVSTAKNTQSDGKQSMTMTQESTTGLEYKVKEVKDSTFVMDVTFKRFAEKMSDGKETVSFDTNGTEPKDEAAKQRWKFNKAIVGNAFEMEIDKDGKVQNISNLWKVRDKVKTSMKADIPAEQAGMLDEFLKAALSDESMQAMFEESVAYYPKKAVKKGDTWERSEKQGKNSSKVTYTFDGVNGDLAVIKINGTSKGNDSNSQKDPQGNTMKLFMSLEGKVNGTVNIDKNSGWINSANISKDETQRMTQEYMGQKVNGSSVTKSTTKIN